MKTTLEYVFLNNIITNTIHTLTINE